LLCFTATNVIKEELTNRQVKKRQVVDITNASTAWITELRGLLHLGSMARRTLLVE
jgi:hypothetical protein